MKIREIAKDGENQDSRDMMHDADNDRSERREGVERENILLGYNRSDPFLATSTYTHHPHHQSLSSGYERWFV